VAGSCYVMDYSGSFTFPVPPQDVWNAIGRLDQFERWWGWLDEFQVDGSGLDCGSVLSGVVSPPVPYRIGVEVHLERCEPCRLIDAFVRGDLEGDAHLRLDPYHGGSLAHVDWSLEMRQAPMRMAALIAYPLLRWGHDRVVDLTVSSFRRQLQGQAVRRR
jgi:carbon monoxide dehydrogenase subunit G